MVVVVVAKMMMIIKVVIQILTDTMIFKIPGSPPFRTVSEVRLGFYLASLGSIFQDMQPSPHLFIS